MQCLENVWEGKSHFVCLVIILRIVLKDLGFFLVVEVPYQIIEPEFLSPSFAIDEPVLVLGKALDNDIAREHTSALTDPQ
jgi:hypothetical protein